MNILLRIAMYFLVVILIVGGAGALGFVYTTNAEMSRYDHRQSPHLEHVSIPAYDPSKPTVAVLLANDVTEVFDFLVPYEMFALTDKYNVFSVAPDTEIKSLTGGLDVIPHYSFAELDQKLGKSPDIIVIPFMPILNEHSYAPVREWIRKHSSEKTILLSICNGAENLADTGLLDGKRAATHWGDIQRLIKTYPQIHWVQDQRYVAQGHIVSSAGLTSGMDATLYVLSQQLGESAAKQIANELRYPSYHYVKEPAMQPFTAGLSDITYILNQSYQWNKTKAGVLLYPGADELALASAFDTYGASGTTTTLTIAREHQPIVTRHGLNLIARYNMNTAPSLSRMIVVGAEAETMAAKDVQQWKQLNAKTEWLWLHQNMPQRFAMEPAFEDLSRQEDVMTARFAAKRLEYRATDHLQLEGAPFSKESFGIPAMLVVLSLCIGYFLDRRLFKKRK